MTTIHQHETAEDRAAPLAPGPWVIDPGHADVSFVGRHFGLTKVRGRFTGVTGTVQIAEPLENSSIDVTIDMATVESGSTARDDHLRSEDLFDVAAHPTATFRSTNIEYDGATGTVTGDLTITGVTHPVVLDVEHLGQVRDPWDNDRAVFSASTRLDREDWGLTWNMVLEAGGLVVSKEITVEIDLELIRS